MGMIWNDLGQSSGICRDLETTEAAGTWGHGFAVLACGVQLRSWVQSQKLYPEEVRFCLLRPGHLTLLVVTWKHVHGKLKMSLISCKISQSFDMIWFLNNNQIILFM